MARLCNSAVVLRARHPAFSFPAILTSTHLTTQKFRKECGHNVDFVAMVLKEDKRHFMLGSEEEVDTIRKSLLKLIIEDEFFIKNACISFDLAASKLLAHCRNNLRQKYVQESSDFRLYDLLSEYYKRYEDVGYHVTKLIFFIPEDLQAEIEKRIRPSDVILLEPPKQSYYNRYQEEYYVLAQKLARSMSRRWGWIPFDYLGNDEWDTSHFLSDINVDFERIREQLRDRERKSLEKKMLLRLYKQKTQRLISDFQRISMLQDDDKAVRNISHTYLQKYLFEEIAKRTGIEKRFLVIMTPLEIKAALLDKQRFQNRLLEERFNASAFIFQDGKISVFQGINNKAYQQLASLIEKVVETDIKGIGVSLGRVSGIVKVCLTSKDIAKVQKGDILVAPMTTPDYSIAMGKAAGFITDEGGFTCHAAVIAREMNIPCIIGTKHATKILKDGDLIELDADKGIVRRL